MVKTLKILERYETIVDSKGSNFRSFARAKTFEGENHMILLWSQHGYMEKSFFNQAELFSQQTSDYLMPIYEYGVDPDVKEFYLITKYFENGNMKNFLKRQKNYKDILKITTDILMGLESLHKKNIYHNYLSMENIFIDKFQDTSRGICGEYQVQQSPEVHTRPPSSVMYYVSPENLEGKKLDHRSDLYNLGGILYHALSGYIPHSEKTNHTMTIMRNRMRGIIELPTVYQPDIPKSLEKYCLKLLEKDPNNRYQSATESINELDKIKHDYGW